MNGLDNLMIMLQRNDSYPIQQLNAFNSYVDDLTEMSFILISIFPDTYMSSRMAI